jgi:putative membrane-bound dehydrogenase-like protein
MKTTTRLCITALIATAAAAATVVTAAEPTVRPEDLPRTKPVEPADALKTFQVRKGFHLEMAAAEPLVIDPIAMCFDENGRLFVVEMRDYSERRVEKLGRIRMLEDTDGDGTFDKATVFVDHLPWPTAVFCYQGGIVIGACPDIIYAKDTTGDGVADEVKTVFTGFGATQERLNVQGLFNNFIWGLDNRIHGCSGLNGGLVRALAGGQGTTAPPPLDVRGKGFVVDPRMWSMTTEAGGGQYGLSYDPWGQLFTCSNSSHIETFMYDARYAGRNPHYAAPNPRVSIAVDGPAAEVYRISPEEPWRVIRTRWRISGLSKGIVEGGGRSAGYFTGATGITVYRGNAFGTDYLGDAFTGDAGGNLVHHKRVRRGADGVELVAERPADEKTSEFCASTDTWFRPVDFANAPDGCLYIADMYRETIEHPWSIPPEIKKYLDLNSGNDRGRIYRLVPDGYARPKPPRLGSATTAELVATLAHPNGWHRETASRLLFERQDKSAVGPLTQLLRTSDSPFGRLHALYALDGLGALSEAMTIAAMDDRDAAVRKHAVELAEAFMPGRSASPALWAKLVALADDADATVRYQLAFTLGQVDHAERAAVLARIAGRDLQSSWVRTAVLSSLSDGAGQLLEPLAKDEQVRRSDAGMSFLGELALLVGAGKDLEQTAHAIDTATATRRSDPKAGFAIARGLAAGADRSASLPTVRARLVELFGAAAETARDAEAPADVRTAAVALLGYADYSTASPPLLEILGKRGSAAQLAALDALGRFDEPAVADDILRVWPSLAPRAADQAVTLLLKRPAHAERLVRAIKSGTLHQTDLSAGQVTQLLAYPDASVRGLAKQTLSAPTTQRTAVVESFRSAVTLAGDRIRGKTVYQQRCISCHRAEGEGFLVGPDLVTVRNSGKEKLLTNILNPSAEVAPSYVAYQVETKDGQSAVGVIANDTPSGLTIRQAYGRETVIPRAQIKRMTSHGTSLMPDGLEAGMTAQDVADLLEFMSTVGAQKP